jgi:hypothetical protein
MNNVHRTLATNRTLAQIVQQPTAEEIAQATKANQQSDTSGIAIAAVVIVVLIAAIVVWRRRR